MMAAYQNIAENGVSACNGQEKVYPCTNDVADLPAADGILFLDANYGLSSMTLLSINPAIEDENSGMKINSTVDLFSPLNGWTENGANYSASFAKLWQGAVATRWNRIIDAALERNATIAAGNGSYADDESLTIPDAQYIGTNNKFFAQDPWNYLSHTEREWPLLTPNGSITQVVHTVRVPWTGGSLASSWSQGTLKTSVKRFLETFAIRVTDDFSYNASSFTGVLWNSSQTAPIGSVPGIKVPLLTMGMTGHWEYLNAEKIYQASGSNDTSIAFVEGASHLITVCTECESYPGQYGDTVKTCFDYVNSWLSKSGRFL